MSVPLVRMDQSCLIIILNQYKGSHWRYECSWVQCASNGANEPDESNGANGTDGADVTNGSNDSATAYDGRNGRVWLGWSQCHEALAALM